MTQLVMLNAADKEAIDAFHRRCFPGDHFTRKAWEELLPDPRTLVYALRDAQGLVALLAVYNWQGEDDYVKIMTLCTRENCRRQGHASRLLKRMIRDMEQLGMHIFKAETRVSNLAMQSLFERMHFARTVRVADMMAHPTEDGYKYQRDDTGTKNP